MKINKKIMGLILGMGILATSVSMPVFASEGIKGPTLVTQEIYEEGPAELDPIIANRIDPKGIFKDYVVSSDAEWIMDGLVGVGAKGWTDIREKSDLDIKRYHYSNIQVYRGTSTWESGRKWGYGKVSVTTGNVGVGALSDYRLFYGF